MKIKVYKTKRKNVTDFKNSEWHRADKELYGENIDWFDEKRQIAAFDDEGNVIGELGISLTSHVAHIKTLIVKKELRNKGIGEALIKKAEELAKEFDCHKIFLETGSTWKARSFYEKLGYKKTGELKKHFFKKDFWIYSKFL
jgi:ribosomal protein S18 acetylase RimI-like enzyme